MANDVQARSGLDYYVEFNGLALSIGVREFDPGIDTVTVDSTAGADGLETTHPIRMTSAPTLTLLIDKSAEGIAIKAALKAGTKGNLIWGEEGNATGKPKWGIYAEVKKANVPMSHDAEQVLDVEFINHSRNWLFDGRVATF